MHFKLRQHSLPSTSSKSENCYWSRDIYISDLSQDPSSNRTSGFGVKKIKGWVRCLLALDNTFSRKFCQYFKEAAHMSQIVNNKTKSALKWDSEDVWAIWIEDAIPKGGNVIPPHELKSTSWPVVLSFPHMNWSSLPEWAVAQLFYHVNWSSLPEPCYCDPPTTWIECTPWVVVVPWSHTWIKSTPWAVILWSSLPPTTWIKPTPWAVVLWFPHVN